MVWCFNSLQTGKRITSNKQWNWTGFTMMFQFSSNGKAYHKAESHAVRSKSSNRFNSLQTGKRITSKAQKATFILKGISSFNSLQTGKRITRQNWPRRSHQDGFQFPSNGKAYHKPKGNPPYGKGPGFQFPSNGKAYHKKKLWAKAQISAQKRVSIPFKRESVSQGTRTRTRIRFCDREFQFPSNGKAYHKSIRKSSLTGRCYLFQFPSNGKAYHKIISTAQSNNQIKVSIPFKRESVSQGIANYPSIKAEEAFQFPSNGKAYHKHRVVLEYFGGQRMLVSIPFKRESVSQDRHHPNDWPRWVVSIPFKRESVSQDCVRMGNKIRIFIVSIPFKRESVSQGRPPLKWSSRWKSFNSLQTGKRITRFRCVVSLKFRLEVSIPFKRESVSQDVVRRGRCGRISLSFQFPSNGKAYHKFPL